MKPAFKYAVICRHRGKYSVGQMCRILQVSRSGYYKYVKQMQHPAKDLELAEKIRVKQESSRRTYGYRRIKLWLDSEGIVKNPKTEPFPQKRTQNRRKKLNKNTEIG